MGAMEEWPTSTTAREALDSQQRWLQIAAVEPDAERRAEAVETWLLDHSPKHLMAAVAICFAVLAVLAVVLGSWVPGRAWRGRLVRWRATGQGRPEVRHPVRQLCASQTPIPPETTGTNRTLNRSGMRYLAFQSQAGQMYFI